MPRRPNTLPTHIYWLYDTRPETVALVGPEGQPFYCGKTIQNPECRLKAHCGDARRRPTRPVYAMLIACGEYVRTVSVETIPPTEDWCAAERRWIANLRLINPNCTNRSDGGDGAPGYIPSDATKALMREKMLGRIISPETRAKMSTRMKGTQIRRGKKLSPEGSARMSAQRTGKKRGPQSAAHRAAIGASQVGKVVSEATKAAQRAAWEIRRLTPVSEETRAKISAKGKGRKKSAQEIENMRAGWVKRKASAGVDKSF